MTIDPYSLLAGRKAELLRWLAEEGRFAPDTGRLLELLCDKLAALGIPIARATAHVRTLHPEYRGASRIWRRGESIQIRTTRHGIEFTSDYQNSPIQLLKLDDRFNMMHASRQKAATYLKEIESWKGCTSC